MTLYGGLLSASETGLSLLSLRGQFICTGYRRCKFIPFIDFLPQSCILCILRLNLSLDSRVLGYGLRLKRAQIPISPSRLPQFLAEFFKLRQIRRHIGLACYRSALYRYGYLGYILSELQNTVKESLLFVKICFVFLVLLFLLDIGKGFVLLFRRLLIQPHGLLKLTYLVGHRLISPVAYRLVFKLLF